MTEAPVKPAVPRGRLVAFYVVVALITAVGIALSISAGQDREPEKAISGGYDVKGGADPCLGEEFDVKQSGQYVRFENAKETLGGKLEVKEGELTGDVECVDGTTQAIEAQAADGRIEGSLGDRALTAERARDALDAGTQRPPVPKGIAGEYRLSPRSICVRGAFELEEHGDDAYEIVEGEEVLGELAYDEGAITGEAECVGGGTAEVTGTAVDRRLNLTLTPAEGAEASEEDAVGEPLTTPERITATKQREFGRTLAAFFIAVAIVMLVARLFGEIAVKIKQPRVMGEVVAGIALGPTLLGQLAPDVSIAVFPTDVIPFIGVAANLGLIFYMFLVGLEIDPAQLKGRIGQAAAISNTSVALPMLLGMAVAVPIYTQVGPDQDFLPFALFMGVAMSITAFPVLARILVERRMLKRPVGALTLACAAIDDVTAWFLIALATAVAVAGGASDVLQTIALAIVFCLAMGLLVRPLIGRVSAAYDEAGRVPGGWIAAIFAGVLLSAYTTEIIGIALIFGAFIMGMVMPRHAGLTEDVTHRIEDFVVTLLLPLFFAYTGLRTNMNLLDRPELLLLTGVLIAVAIVGKLFGAMIAARLTGFGWRESAVVGTLMNTRGLTELIVLNLALEQGVISEALFAALVIMALVTTFMAGPFLRLLDPKNELGAPVEEELEDARRASAASLPAGIVVPERSILVAPQPESRLEPLLALAEPLARSEPPRELILTRLVRPPRGASARGGLQTEDLLLQEATAEVERAREELLGRGIAARAVAFISPDPSADLLRLAGVEDVDLVLMDGRRPLLGDGVPKGEVGETLKNAPSDVAVLVAREGDPVEPGPDRPVLVPFGGAEHDWAALELGGWIAASTGAPLRLLGAAGETDERARVSRMLADAGLLLQAYAGVSTQPVVSERGRTAIVEAAAGAGLLVLGLGPRWEQEGLGIVRSAVARSAPAPVIFVRRGERAGALAPRDNFTQFGWSSPGMSMAGAPGGIDFGSGPRPPKPSDPDDST